MSRDILRAPVWRNKKKKKKPLGKTILSHVLRNSRVRCGVLIVVFERNLRVSNGHGRVSGWRRVARESTDGKMRTISDITVVFVFLSARAAHAARPRLNKYHADRVSLGLLKNRTHFSYPDGLRLRLYTWPHGDAIENRTSDNAAPCSIFKSLRAVRFV